MIHDMMKDTAVESDAGKMRDFFSSSSSKNELTMNQECLDFSWAVGLNRFSLQLMGIWSADKEVDSKSLNILLRVPFMMLVIFFGIFLPQMYAITLVINELPLVIENLMTSCAAFTSCVKLFFIWRSKEVLRPVMKSMMQDWFRSKSQWELKIMKRAAWRARFITIADYTIMAGCYSGFVVMPLLGFNLRTITNITDYGERHLLVQSYYPYDYSRSPQFELIHFFQLLGSFFVGMAVSVPDDYFGVLVFHFSAQFGILSVKIENSVQGVANGMQMVMNKRSDKKLGGFINRHVHLIRMISALEQSFSFVIAAQIFCMSIMVCCLGFQTLGMIGSGGEKPTLLQMVTLIGTLFTMMLHTLVDCFASETLASRSANIFFNIYSSKWYLLPPEKVRCLIPMMMMSKVPRQIKAGKILNMSLATYCSIIKSTAGYISMLIAVSGD